MKNIKMKMKNYENKKMEIYISSFSSYHTLPVTLFVYEHTKSFGCTIVYIFCDRLPLFLCDGLMCDKLKNIF